MPFRTDGTNTGPSTSTLRVDPDQVLHLKTELQSIHDEVNKFLNRRAPAMTMRPLGADLVSSETAEAFNENSLVAIEVARGYLNELENILVTLDRAVRTYDLVEDTNTRTFRRSMR
ncbi:PE domain-containing protein [Actinophytocola sp.]|uniref:PE domain-containing protein n=1 Tax=Actinophytocola sp. TaxID=1872138 RepID=UPI00389B29E8